MVVGGALPPAFLRLEESCSTALTSLATHSREALRLFAFPQTSSFTLEFSQVVKFGATYTAGPNQVNVINYRCVDGEDTFNTLAEADLPHRDGLAQSGVVPRDHSTFKRLQPLFVPFLDANVDANRVPRPELRMSLSTGVLTNEFADKSILHINSALYRARRSGRGATFLFCRETPIAAIA